MSTQAPRSADAQRRFRVFAVAMFVSMFGLVAMSAWAFGTGKTLFGGVAAVAAAIEGMGALYFWMRSNG